MNKIYLILLSLILLIGCDGNNIMNSNPGYERIYLDNVTLTITEIRSYKVAFDITNNETFTIPQEWADFNKFRVEGYLYTDSTLTNYCGKHTISIYNILEPGETMTREFWGLCDDDDWDYTNLYIDKFKAYQILFY